MMQITPEVIALLQAGKNPLDFIKPNGEIMQTVQVMGTR